MRGWGTSGSHRQHSEPGEEGKEFGRVRLTVRGVARPCPHTHPCTASTTCVW